MPPKERDPLPETLVSNFVEWVKMGAPDPRSDEGERLDFENERDQGKHWSFQPLSTPTPPVVSDTAWPRDPIDLYVLARLEMQNHIPVRDASGETLVRRLYFDLIGLAPSIEEVRSFAASYEIESQRAAAQLVDQLLASPHFGERWGRHWLDVARYGESNGNDGLGRNPTFPHAWRYRDYVIKAFNDDVPYDRFLKEQIAGDLLPASTAEQRNRQLVATGFLAIGSKPALAMNQNFAMDVVDDQIDVVSTTVMALSVSCARCHDHKHDPISSRDYYALAGIFNSTETLWGKAGNELLGNCFSSSDFLELHGPGKVGVQEARHPAVIHDENRVLGNLFFPAQYGRETLAVKRGSVSRFDLVQVQQGRQNVLDLSQPADVLRLCEIAFRPANEAWNARSAFPEFRFLTTHPRVEGPVTGLVLQFDLN